MTTPRDPDSLLSAYLADGIDVLPDRVVDAVLDEAHRTRQRVVFGPRRTPVMNSTFKVILAAAAVIAVVVAGINFLPRNDAAVGGPSSPSTSASPLPSPSQQVDRMGLGGTNQHFNVDLPEGWENNEWVANNHPLGGDTAFIVGLVDNTFEDPCAEHPTEPKGRAHGRGPRNGARRDSRHDRDPTRPDRRSLGMTQRTSRLPTRGPRPALIRTGTRNPRG